MFDGARRTLKEEFKFILFSYYLIVSYLYSFMISKGLSAWLPEKYKKGYEKNQRH